MSVARLHAPEAALGGRVVLADHTAHHVREVLRLRAADAVRVFDGAGREYEATLELVTRREVVARIGAECEARPESPLSVTLAVAALKGDRMELVIQKAAELGVAEIWPVVTIRTDAAARPALRGSRQERWEKVASGAAEQCGRAIVPRVAPTQEFSDLLATPFEGRRLFFLETEGVAGIEVAPKPTAALLLVGPPGGWDEREVASAARAGFEAASLGPRVLRTETAAIAAVTVVQVLWGDLV